MDQDFRAKKIAGDIRIIDVTITLFRWTDLPAVTYTRNSTSADGEGQLGLVTIKTNAGIEGHAFLGSSIRSAYLDVRGLIDQLKPQVLGCNPLDREMLYKRLMAQSRGVMLRAIGAMDIALWDIAGKVANMPIHQLLGSARRKVPAYASSSTLASIDDYVTQALEVKAAGYKGYKSHPPRDRALHVPMLRAVRKAVGDDYPLMYDPAAIYDYGEAVRIGRVCEELGYLWLEDPMPVDNVYGYTKLCAELDIPVLATEYSSGGFPGFAIWVHAQATDALRGDVAVKGGITPCIKGVHLAEAFGMTFELHHGGNSLNNVANLHVALASDACTYLEVILPDAAQRYGLIEDVEIDSEGYIAAFDGPGLGASIDFDLIDNNLIEILA
jgi:L-alanine-DL-glutamate epimerase-like enolase superfamily enzyme